jgi:hypothetical protein
MIKLPAANSDGLIKCLPPARTVSQSVPEYMREKFKSSVNFCTTGQFRLPYRFFGLLAAGLVPTGRYVQA